MKPRPTCLQRGLPACPALYYEEEIVAIPQYIWMDEVEGTAILQTKVKVLIGWKDQLHMHFRQCLLGEGHEGGHLTDTSWGRVRWWPEEDDD